MRVVIAVAALAATLAAADWTLYRSLPFEVSTDRDKKHAREVLNHLDQLRWAFSQISGKMEPRTLWPVKVIVTRGPSSPQLRLVHDAWVGTLDDKAEVPSAWNAQLAQIFIEDNLGRMTPEIERGLVAILSNAEVSGTHIILGQPVPKPTLDWARMHVLVTSEEYRGRVKVLIANLSKGVDSGVAFRNGLGKTAEEIEKQAQTQLAAKTVATYDMAGKPVNAQRDYQAREADEATIKALLKPESAPDTALGRMAVNDFDAAVKLKPEWAEPWKLMAALEQEPGKKAGLMKKAAELSPRDGKLWTEFALLMHSYNRFADSDKAWAGAERAAADPTERQQIRARREGLVEARLQAEEDARREEKLAKERELQRLKNEAVARIREAEGKFNGGKAALDPEKKIEAWWDGPKGDAKVEGRLVRVDCLGKQLRVAVEVAPGKVAQLLVPDPGKIAIEGKGELTLGCGPQRSARRVMVEFIQKMNPKMNTVGEVAVIRFP